MQENENIIEFAQTDIDGKRTRFGIKEPDRARHMYIIGEPGMGKTSLLKYMAAQDIARGSGVTFWDTKGSAAIDMLNYVPRARKDDIVYFAPSDPRATNVSFNVFEGVSRENRNAVAASIAGAFEHVWHNDWSARMHHILVHIFLALMEYPGANFADVERMLADGEFRRKVVNTIGDEAVKSFWLDEYENKQDNLLQKNVLLAKNKIHDFISDSYVRDAVCSLNRPIDILDIIDNGKIFITNLSYENIGKDNGYLLGVMLMTKIYCVASSRAGITARALMEKQRFKMFLDDFPMYTNKHFSDFIAEARKYKLDIVLANERVEDVDEDLRSVIFGNIGTVIVFRVNDFDANIFEKEFARAFSADDISSLKEREIILRLVIDGVGSKPFRAELIPLSSPTYNTANELFAPTPARAHTESGVERNETNTNNNIPVGGKGARAKNGPQKISRTDTHTPFKNAFARAWEENAGDAENGDEQSYVSLSDLKNKKARNEKRELSGNKEKLKKLTESAYNGTRKNGQRDNIQKSIVQKEISEDTLKKILE